MYCGLAAAQSDFRFDTWTTDRGLPQNSVTSIIQARDSYVWMTTAGLQDLVVFRDRRDDSFPDRVRRLSAANLAARQRAADSGRLFAEVDQRA